MAKTGTEPAGTAGSQFYIVTAPDAGLPPDYAVLGKVVKGQDVVDADRRARRSGQRRGRHAAAARGDRGAGRRSVRADDPASLDSRAWPTRSRSPTRLRAARARAVRASSPCSWTSGPSGAGPATARARARAGGGRPCRARSSWPSSTPTPTRRPPPATASAGFRRQGVPQRRGGRRVHRRAAARRGRALLRRARAVRGRRAGRRRRRGVAAPRARGRPAATRWPAASWPACCSRSGETDEALDAARGP